MAAASFDAFQRNQTSAFVSGAGIGTLAGLIGLGGAEFRLPFLISLYQFGALEAVIINKTMSLVVVMSALPFRTGTISFDTLLSHWPVILNLLGGSVFGAWFGAGWATKLRSDALYRIIAVLLVGMAVILILDTAPKVTVRPCSQDGDSSLPVSPPASQSVWWRRSWASRAASF